MRTLIPTLFERDDQKRILRLQRWREKVYSHPKRVRSPKVVGGRIPPGRPVAVGTLQAHVEALDRKIVWKNVQLHQVLSN